VQCKVEWFEQVERLRPFSRDLPHDSRSFVLYQKARQVLYNDVSFHVSLRKRRNEVLEKKAEGRLSLSSSSPASEAIRKKTNRAGYGRRHPARDPVVTRRKDSFSGRSALPGRRMDYAAIYSERWREYRYDKLSENSLEFFNANLCLAQNALQSFWGENAMCRDGETNRTASQTNM